MLTSAWILSDGKRGPGHVSVLQAFEIKWSLQLRFSRYIALHAKNLQRGCSKAEYWAFHPRCKRRGRDKSDLDGLCVGAIPQYTPNGSDHDLISDLLKTVLHNIKLPSTCSKYSRASGHPSLSHEETSWNHHWLETPSLPVFPALAPTTGLYFYCGSLVFHKYSLDLRLCLPFSHTFCITCFHTK